jgi:hypothetical protein
MRETISKPLKLTFLVHFFVAILFGLVYLVFLEFYVEVTNWPYWDPIAGRTLGAMFIGLGMASLLCWRETQWAKVKIVVQMEIAWLIIGTIVQFWGAFFPIPHPPIIIWLNVIVCLIFCIAFCWFYYRQEMGK